MREQIANLEEKIKARDAAIQNLIDKNNKGKLRLEKLKLSLQAKISEERLQRAKASCPHTAYADAWQHLRCHPPAELLCARELA